MSRMALVASLRFVRISRRSFCPSSWPKTSWRRSFSFLHTSRTCRTGCRPSRHVHIGSWTSGTFCQKRKSFRPIFSVRSWTRIELWFLLRPLWSRNTIFEGTGVYRNDTLPLLSACRRDQICLIFTATVQQHSQSTCSYGYCSGCVLLAYTLNLMHSHLQLVRLQCAFPELANVGWADVFRTLNGHAESAQLTLKTEPCKATSYALRRP